MRKKKNLDKPEISVFVDDLEREDDSASDNSREFMDALWVRTRKTKEFAQFEEIKGNKKAARKLMKQDGNKGKLLMLHAMYIVYKKQQCCTESTIKTYIILFRFVYEALHGE